MMPADEPAPGSESEPVEFESGPGYVRAVCKPDGYCKLRHRCGKLDLGLTRERTKS